MPIDGATGFSRDISAGTVDAGIQVWQQSGLLQHHDAHGSDVLERRVVAGFLEPGLGLGPPVLGPVTQREQRLLAAQRRTVARDGTHFVG
ncbi:hypothetical protein [Aeromicrobium sp. UC242_57]|uniref:hypothetical protein n=1 Tax=Aeromicrobium sp. UC242_57 TaxID=3374624 RepID=UPI0037B4EE84